MNSLHTPSTLGMRCAVVGGLCTAENGLRGCSVLRTCAVLVGDALDAQCMNACALLWLVCGARMWARPSRRAPYPARRAPCPPPSFPRGVLGSQSTDVDPPYQKGALSPTKLAQLLHLPESEQALLRKTEEDFYSESLEVGGWCSL